SRAISASADARPAAPQSWSDSTRPRSTSSTETSISLLPVNGSPICTDGRFSCASSPSSWLASTLAPPIPSRPGAAPETTSALPPPRPRPAGPVAAGGGAVDDDRVPLAARAGAHQPLDREEADAHRVHERV